MLLVLFQAVLIIAQETQTWCGKPECPPQPQCQTAELDLIIAIDASCSMTGIDFEKQRQFAAALVNATQARFKVSRFAGIIFGTKLASYTTPITQEASRIFHPMQSDASKFIAAIPSAPSDFTTFCGGTPTDEALVKFHAELLRTRIPGRMQVAVLATDGIPTMCFTDGGRCTGVQETSALTATNAAIKERFDVNKLPSLGSLVFTIGIGSSLNATIGNTVKYGVINGSQLLTNFASSPKFAFNATSFATLVSVTLNEVLDLLCSYLITVEDPKPASCIPGGTPFIVKAYNFFEVGTPKCRWNQVGTTDYLFTSAIITPTDAKFEKEPGVVGLVTCPAPTNPPADPYNAVLEISRDGTYYTNNQYSVLIRKNCSAPIVKLCPNASIASVFSQCESDDFPSNCSSTCKTASINLASSFSLNMFSQEQARDCILAASSTIYSSADKRLLASFIGKTFDACQAPSPTPQDAANAASIASASLLCLIIGFLLA